MPLGPYCCLVDLGCSSRHRETLRPNSGKMGRRFVDFAQMFMLILAQPDFIDDLPTLQNGQTNSRHGRLKENMLKMNQSSADIKNARAHHIIAWEFKDHPVIIGTNMDMNHPSNGIFLSNEQHVGGHHDYRMAMKLELNRIERLPKSQWRAEVIKLRNTSGFALYNGAPLIERHGSRPGVWRNIMRGK